MNAIWQYGSEKNKNGGNIMSIFPNDYKISVGPMRKTPFLRHKGVRSDGTLVLFRDVDGKLWSIAGHTNSGHVSMFCGNTVEDMKELYKIYNIQYINDVILSSLELIYTALEIAIAVYGKKD